MSSNRLNINGEFYTHLSNINNYSSNTRKCIENTLEKLTNTSPDRPGLLLGEIQSGKTKTFIGTIALAFDNNYDMAIILTKSTIALTKQTHSRLVKEFDYFTKKDAVQLFDIMSLPNDLTNFELEQKTIIIAKKQTNNLNRLNSALFHQYPHLSDKRILIIDDEADYASIGYEKKEKDIDPRVIAKMIGDIKQRLKNSNFLQVTATPYALFLQPNTSQSSAYLPLKPLFTEIVPVPEDYIGGNYYFKKSQDRGSIAYFLYQQLPLEELKLLNRFNRDQLKSKDPLLDKNIASLRSAFINFIVGGVIRRFQQEKVGLQPEKYSFLIHTEQKKLVHERQKDLFSEMKRQLHAIAKRNPDFLVPIIKASYINLLKSISKTDLYTPEFTCVKEAVIQAFLKDNIMIATVNSDKEIDDLLDKTGQLKLRVPFNIFIGGQTLDRGITIRNLIGFCYGRSPKKFQQDTVLQHSRMYGYRSSADLAVTRFYTTSANYSIMKNIYEMDKALRAAIKSGTDKNSMIFLEKDISNKIIPCSPNKIIASRVTTLNPLKRFLPVGFQTKSNFSISKTIKKIDNIVDNLTTGSDPVLIDIEDAEKILRHIYRTYTKNKKIGEQWDVEAFISCMSYLACNIAKQNNGKVWLVTRKGRNIARFRKSTGRYEDAPDTASGENNELNVAKRIAVDNPALILTRQQGVKSQKWNDAEFWWPVLVTPINTPTVIYTSEQGIEQL
jgi:hypothetical protein